MGKFILEATRSIDENGVRIPITENTPYMRYGSMEYDSYDEAMVARYEYMMESDHLYIRVKDKEEKK